MTAFREGKGYKFLLAHVYTGDVSCIDWPYATTGRGYGQLSGGTYRDAHREMCYIAHGEPPTTDSVAMHVCHNKLCINPNHIRWGTQSENCSDLDKNVYLEYAGKRQTINAWARELGVGKHLISKRHFAGWSVEDTLTRPSQKKKS